MFVYVGFYHCYRTTLPLIVPVTYYCSLRITLIYSWTGQKKKKERKDFTHLPPSPFCLATTPSSSNPTATCSLPAFTFRCCCLLLLLFCCCTRCCCLLFLCLMLLFLYAAACTTATSLSFSLSLYIYISSPYAFLNYCCYACNPCLTSFSSNNFCPTTFSLSFSSYNLLTYLPISYVDGQDRTDRRRQDQEQDQGPSLYPSEKRGSLWRHGGGKTLLASW